MFFNGSYTVDCRLEVLRNGVLYKTLAAEDMRVDMTESGAIKTSLSCVMGSDPDVDLLGDRLRPVQAVDGIDYPLGVFLVSQVEERAAKGGVTLSIDAYDQGLLLQQAALEGRTTLRAGSNYLEVVQGLLTQVGISRAVVEPCALTLRADREDWEVGTSLLEVVNALLTECNYRSLWFDRDGAARLGKPQPADAAHLTRSYRAGGYSVLCDGLTRRSNAYAAYNVFTAVVSSAEQEMVAVSVNDSPLSPLSTVRRGRRVCAPVEYLDAIASQLSLQEYADGLRAVSMLASETVQFETAPVPTHQVGEVVALDDGIYKETGWSLTLGPGGSYTHQARRVILG